MTDRRNGRPRRTAALRVAALVVTAACLAALAPGCGGKRLAAGTVPFPSDRPVFFDEEGRPLRALPASPEPLKIVFLDYPWCPPCSEAWEAVRASAGTLPPGSLRVYRILFDRERFFTRDGVRVVPPLRPAAAQAQAASPAFAVTKLTADADAFRDEYEVRQAPVVLLLSADGKVLKRWTGYFPSLSASLVEEIGRPQSRDQDSTASPPP